MNLRHGRYLDVWRKSSTATTKECCEQYGTSPGGSTLQSNFFTATNHPSRKLSKLDEADMPNTAGEVGTSSCTPVDHLTWPSKSGTTSINLHTADLC